MSDRPSIASYLLHVLDRVLRPDPEWLRMLSARKAAGLLVVTLLGSAMYGFTVGSWRSLDMGWYVALKMPLLIVLTLGCNALLNGLLGMLLHGSLGFRQSLAALLWSFATAAVLLASLAPVTLGLAWNAPAPDAVNASSAHAGYLLTHTILIAAVGIFSNIHLHRMLHGTDGGKGSLITLLSWLAGNGLLGSQFSWILRPFFGSPNLKVQFLRDDPLNGTFYEAVWNAFLRLSAGSDVVPLIVVAMIILMIAYVTKKITNQLSNNKTI